MDDNPRLRAARDLIKAKDFDAARTLLEKMPDNPQAKAWLDYLDITAPEQEEKRKNKDLLDDDDIFAEDTTYNDPDPEFYYPGQRKLKNDYLDIDEPKNYMTYALLTLGLYWFVAPAGYIANIYFLLDARKIRREEGRTTQNVGCLWAMLIVSIGSLVLGTCLFLLFLPLALIGL